MKQSAPAAACLPEKKKMDALGRLSCNVAHDFNNILGGLGGFTALAMACVKENDPLARDLKEIKVSVAKAARLAKQLSIFGGRQLMESKLCAVNDVIMNTLKRTELVPAGNFKIEARPGAGLPGIMADGAQLEQALVNLLVNAREAMPDGGTAVISSTAIRCRGAAVKSPDPGAAGDLFLKITVEDCGTGLSAEAMEHLFEPLFSTRKKGNSSGLGLSTVYGIVKQHNGWVEVISDPGNGSEFALFLPAISKQAKVADLFGG